MDDLAIIELVVNRLRSEFGSDLLGVLAGGSRLRGEGDARSDLDTVVVIERPRRRRCNLVIAGVEIECSSIRRSRCGAISRRSG
jgi:predicted nucleotidyltransferase